MTASDGYPTHADVLREVEWCIEQAQRHGAAVIISAARAHAAQSWEDACFTVQELVRRIGAAVAERRKVDA